MLQKKLIACASVLLVILAAGCQSHKGEIAEAPEYVNMTGVWEFTYGSQSDMNGRMSLHQNGYKITGVSNNKMGEYKITGEISGTKLSLQGTDFNRGSNFICVAKISGENTFTGDYSVNGQKEKILAKRAE